MLAADLLEHLRTGERVDAPVVVVVAHPDDETIGLGARLSSFSDLTLIHVTDGAPLDMRDARSKGFSTREAYAAGRRVELEAALAALGAAARWVALALPDQDVIDHLGGLIGRLQSELAGAAAVITHAYEGGHPDHDACALAVKAASSRLGARGPVRLEFAAYHGRGGRLVPNGFWPDPDRPETVAQLGPEERQRKAAAIACFVTQAGMLDQFPVGQERFREAPDYDFAGLPPPGECLYDRFGFAQPSQAWRTKAAAALAELEAGRVA